MHAQTGESRSILPAHGTVELFRSKEKLDFSAGLTIAELLVDFRYLDRADVPAASEFAAAAVQERERPWPSGPSHPGFV